MTPNTPAPMKAIHVGVSVGQLQPDNAIGAATTSDTSPDQAVCVVAESMPARRRVRIENSAAQTAPARQSSAAG